MRNTVVTVLCAAAIYLSAACQQQSPPPPAAGQREQAAVDPADVAFGYTDTTGSKLLMLAEDNRPMDVEKAKTMAAAVCSEGRDFPIRYVQLQERTAADSGRQSAFNFANDEGHLFEVVQGQAEPGDTCLLVPAGYLQAFPISRNDFPKSERDERQNEYERQQAVARIRNLPFDPSPFQSLTEFAKLSVARIGEEKGRITKMYWPLHRSGVLQEVAAVEFSAMGDSLLGGLVLVEPTRLSFFDMPASLTKGREDGGCWRVDDDCQFQFAGMGVPAVLGEAGRHVVFFTYPGAEGTLIVLFQARDGKLVELRRSYRYQAPV
jgi:hypothetical protein